MKYSIFTILINGNKWATNSIITLFTHLPSCDYVIHVAGDIYHKSHIHPWYQHRLNSWHVSRASRKWGCNTYNRKPQWLAAVVYKPGTIIRNKTASLQKEAVRTQVALWFFFMLKWNLCLSKQNVWTQKLIKVYCVERLYQKKMIAFVYKGHDMSFEKYHPSNK